MVSMHVRLVVIALATVACSVADVVANENDSKDAAFTSHRCVCKCPSVDASFFNVVHQSKRRGSYMPSRRSVYVNATVVAADCNCPRVVFPYLLRPGGVVNEYAKSGRRSDIAFSAEDISLFQESFCPRCKCRYEVRNLAIVRVVVIGIVCVIAILLAVMVCLAVEWRLNGTRGGDHNIFVRLFDWRIPITPSVVGTNTFGSSSSFQTRYAQQVDDDDADVMSSAGGSADDAVRSSFGVAAAPSTAPSAWTSGVASRLPWLAGLCTALRLTRLRWQVELQRQRYNVYEKRVILN